MSANTKSKAQPVTEETFEQIILKSEVPVLVDFWADWCPPCKILGPTIDELAGDFAGRAVVAKVDVDASPKLGARYNVASIPTTILFQNGEPYARVTGIVPKDTLTKMLSAAIDQE